MRTPRPSPEHQEAVSRRLALLSAELAGVRDDPDPPTVPRGSPTVVREREPEPESGVALAMPPTHTRVSTGRADPAPAPEEPSGAPPGRAEPPELPVPSALPRPGRHAARRPGRPLADVLPGTVRGRVALGPAQVALVAVVVAIGLAVTCWWIVRGDAREVAAPVLAQTAEALTSEEPAAPDPTAAVVPVSQGGLVTVDVAGKVRRPGIAVLDAGSRVIDALKAAGGARSGVDLTSLNLARLLVDGEQILVGVPGVPGVTAAAAPGGSAPGALVNLNTADLAELETLPDIGPVTAEAIISWRTEHGGFTAIDELLEVDGIGEATLDTLTPHVTV